MSPALIDNRVPLRAPSSGRKSTQPTTTAEQFVQDLIQQVGASSQSVGTGRSATITANATDPLADRDSSTSPMHPERCIRMLVVP